MAQSGLSIAKLAALTIFGMCVIALLILDNAILSSGQIGFLTVMLYYVVFVICAPVYWYVAVRSGIKKFRWLELTLTAVFAVAPLTFTVYGYGGPV